jgi:hypothetical protein
MAYAMCLLQRFARACGSYIMHFVFSRRGLDKYASVVASSGADDHVLEGADPSKNGRWL